MTGRVDSGVEVVLRRGGGGRVSSVRRLGCLACAIRELTGGASAVDEVADLFEEREPLLAEGIRLGVSLRDVSERDK